METLSKDMINYILQIDLENSNTLLRINSKFNRAIRKNSHSMFLIFEKYTPKIIEKINKSFLNLMNPIDKFTFHSKISYIFDPCVKITSFHFKIKFENGEVKSFHIDEVDYCSLFENKLNTHVELSKFTKQSKNLRYLLLYLKNYTKNQIEKSKIFMIYCILHKQ
jgi:hypothetical protein